MATIKVVVEGLQILAKYTHEDAHVAAHHDILYGPYGVDVKAVSEEDKEKLEKLGWHQDSGADNCWAKFT